MKEASEPKIARKAYKTPELTVYGQIRELTLKGSGDTHADHMNRTTTFMT
ncbi:MAG: hypothetical protein WA871_14060 [Candidatus Acidiferrales bacterium]